MAFLGLARAGRAIWHLSEYSPLSAMVMLGNLGWVNPEKELSATAFTNGNCQEAISLLYSASLRFLSGAQNSGLMQTPNQPPIGTADESTN